MRPFIFTPERIVAMISNKKIALLGGDTRQIALARRLVEVGLSVKCFGLPQAERLQGVTALRDWRDAVSGACLLVLPLPASPDGKHLNLPLDHEREAPRVADIFDAVPAGVAIAGGKFSPAIKQMAEEKGVHLYDYFDCEALQQKNALPTAEGAVSVLMREVPRTVSGLSVGVTGFGRVARALVGLLLAMGAKVTVLARNAEQLRQAAALGCCTVSLSEKRAMEHFTAGKAAIFNTVPYWLFSEEALANTSPETLIIDLASAPGGVDANAASGRGIKVIWALSLPGKYAPVTAGEIIAETVLDYMKREGIL